MDNVENEKFTWKTQLGLQYQVGKTMLITGSYSLRYFHTGNNSYFHFSRFSVIVHLRNSVGFPLFFPHPFLQELLSCSSGIFALLVDSLKFPLEMEMPWKEHFGEGIFPGSVFHPGDNC